MSLKVMRLSEEPGEPMPGEGHVGVKSVMAVEETQVESYSCRVMRIAPGGGTAMHSHPRVHVVVALSGRARVETGREAVEIKPGMVVTLPGDLPHRFVNVTNRGASLMVQNMFPRAAEPQRK
jgi:quercetin dioxygenase-like cupin family protein